MKKKIIKWECRLCGKKNCTKGLVCEECKEKEWDKNMEEK